MARLRMIGAAIAAPVAGLGLVPASEDAPSGLTVLRLLPAGLAGAAISRPPRVPALEAQVSTHGVHVHLCGVCHIEPASAEAARAAVSRAARGGRLAAVALECNQQTLAMLQCAHRALSGLPRERVRSEGASLVREALFRSPTVRQMAENAGASLDTPSSVGLPPTLVRHLSSDGVLWSDEMRAAADAADAWKARVVCLGAPPEASHTPHAPSTLGAALGIAAVWLRAHALRPGLDDRGCDAADVAAMNTAMQEMLPGFHAHKVVEPDDQMAMALLALCKEVSAEQRSSRGSHRPMSVVAVVGAQHVPGLKERLARA